MEGARAAQEIWARQRNELLPPAGSRPDGTFQPCPGLAGRHAGLGPCPRPQNHVLCMC